MSFMKILKIILFSILFLAVAAYLVYSFFIMESTNPEEKCAKVVMVIDDGDEVFVDSAKAVEILKEANLYPLGKKMKDIDMQEIEHELLKNTFITSVDCYGSNNGMAVGTGALYVKIKQIVPVALVYDAHGEKHYVDPQGNIVETDTLYARNMLVANGEISRSYMVSDIAQFAQYVKQDPFWDNQIEQVYVEFDKNKERVVTLIPRVGDQKIYLGLMDGYDKKLERLKKFYERGMPVVGWKKYSVLNLEYDNQVVGIIKGQERKDSVVVIPDQTGQSPDAETTAEQKHTDAAVSEKTEKTSDAAVKPVAKTDEKPKEPVSKNESNNKIENTKPNSEKKN